jgi:defect-in-organelle-trafficking protein DotD
MPPTRFRAALAVSALAALSGCGDHGETKTKNPTAPIVYDNAIQQEVDQQIAQAANRAANALETTAMIERAKSPPVGPTVNLDSLPPEMRAPITLEWSGPADDLAREMARKVGYSFRESGAIPAAPMMAHVGFKDVATAQAFSDVGLQISSFAVIVLDPWRKTVEYRNLTAPGGMTTGYEPSGSPARHHRRAHHQRPAQQDPGDRS